MLNSKALTELLTKNSDEKLCKRWFLITPNGTLLAYSKPTNIRNLRKQVATAAISWQEHRGSGRNESTDAGGEPMIIKTPGLLRTLTVETESANIIIRKIQPQLLLVLEGGIPPRKQSFEPSATPEGPGDPPYPSTDGNKIDSVTNSSASSFAESSKSSASVSILQLQRRKLDALATAIAQDLEKTGFKMPDEGIGKLF